MVEADKSNGGDPGDTSAPPTAFRLDGLLLLGSDGANPLQLDGITLVFDEHGVQVSTAADRPRILPWVSLTTHLVEPWNGEVTPEWWVDPELNRVEDDVAPVTVTDPDATNRPLPHLQDGALISLRTPFATYRFLQPGGDASALGPRIAALAVDHQGPTGAPAVTTVATSPLAPAGEDGGSRVTWRQVQPMLVVLLVVFLVVSVILILLQSAGTIHLPFLGGAGPGTVGPLRTR